MFHQTTLDQGLHRVMIAQRRAESRALHRPLPAKRRHDMRPCCPESRPAACCA